MFVIFGPSVSPPEIVEIGNIVIFSQFLWVGSCYLSRIRFANWVRQESELFNLFLSNKVSNSKKWVSN